jgi:chromosome segregation ATPase
MVSSSSPESRKDKKSLFAHLKGGGDKESKNKQNIPQDKPIKEKKAKKTEKKDKAQSGCDGKKSTGGGLFGSGSKKKPRAEYQAEIDTLTIQLQELQTKLQDTERKLQDTEAKYDRLQRWAKNPPISLA